MKRIALACLMTLLAAGALRAAEQVDYAKELARLLPEMSSDDLGKRKAAQDEWSNLCLAAGQPGAEDARLAACKAMLPALAAATPVEARVWVIRQLQYIGKAESVAALTALFTDKSDRIRECARRALVNNPAPEAVVALRAELAKTTDPAWRVALINALADKRDAEAVAMLGALTGCGDETVALAACAALGKIGGPEAAKALTAARGKAKGHVLAAAQDASLACADMALEAGDKAGAAATFKDLYQAESPTPVRAAALRGLLLAQGDAALPLLVQALSSADDPLRLTALQFVGLVRGPAATTALTALLPKLDAAGKISLLGALADVGDAAAKPAVMACAKEGDEAVRAAALDALAGVGDAADVPFLVATAAGSEGAIQAAARRALDGMKAKGVDPIIEGQLAGDPRTQAEALRSLTARRFKMGVASMMKLVASDDNAVRTEAFKGIEALGTMDAAALLIQTIQTPKDPADRDVARKALGAVVARADSPEAADVVVKAVGASEGEVKAALLKSLGQVGGEKALAAVRAALADAKVHDDAVRVMADWPDGAALDDLLKLAQTEEKVPTQVLALRGFIRLADNRDRKDKEKVALFAEALKAARRPEDKRMALGPLGNVNTMEALLLAAPLMDDEKTAQEAAACVAKIGKRVGGKLPPAFKDAMDKAIAVTKNTNVRRDAEDALKRYKP
jgi:HEAT repeat protein